MCSLLLKHNPKPGLFDRFMGRVLDGMTKGYGVILHWTLTAFRIGPITFSRRWLVVGVMLLAAWGSFQLFKTAKTELSPMEDRGVILIIINGPDGATLELARLANGQSAVRLEASAGTPPYRWSVNGVPLLDLEYIEDSACDTDMNVVMTGSGGFVELQGTAEGVVFTRDEMNALLDLADQGIRQLVELQNRA